MPVSSSQTKRLVESAFHQLFARTEDSTQVYTAINGDCSHGYIFNMNRRLSEFVTLHNCLLILWFYTLHYHRMHKSILFLTDKKYVIFKYFNVKVLTSLLEMSINVLSQIHTYMTYNIRI